jgi:hypothetical protein
LLEVLRLEIDQSRRRIDNVARARLPTELPKELPLFVPAERR